MFLFFLYEGFMKKALRDALESEGVIIDNRDQAVSPGPARSSTPKQEISRTQSTPSSPENAKRPSATLQRHRSEQLLKSDISTPADPRQRFLEQQKADSTHSFTSQESASSLLNETEQTQASSTTTTDALVTHKKTR